MIEQMISTEIEKSLEESSSSKVEVKIEIEGLNSPCSFHLPKSVSDLSLDQFDLLACYYFIPGRLKDVFKFKLMQSILGIEEIVFGELDPEAIKDLTLIFNDILTKKPVSNRSFYQGVDFKDSRLMPPPHHFSHFIWDEYIAAESYFTAYLKTNDQQFLDKLVGLLLRDKREKFQRSLETEGFEYYFKNEDQWVKKLNSILGGKFNFNELINGSSGLRIKYGLLLNYMAIRNYWADKRYFHVFSQTSPPNKNPYHWNELAVDLAGDKFGKPEEVKRTLAVHILTHLNKESKLAKKRKK